MGRYLPRGQFAHKTVGKVLSNTGGGALRDRILVGVITIFRAPAVNGFGSDPAGVVIFICDGGVVVAGFRQTAEGIVSERHAAEYPVAVALGHFLVGHLVCDTVLAVQVSAVGEGGADAAPGGIVEVSQRAPGKISFCSKLPGFVIRQAVMLTFGVGDFSQAGEFIVTALQPFAVRADNSGQQVKRAIFIAGGITFAIGDAFRQLFAVLAHQFAHAVRTADFFHAALRPGMVLTVAELLLTSQRVGQADDTAFLVVSPQPDLITRCGQPGELTVFVIVVIQTVAARQGHLADIAFVVVLILRSTSQRIGAGLKLRVLPDGDFFPAQRVKAAGDQAIFVIPVVGFTAFGIKFLLGCLCAGLSASLSACSPVAGKPGLAFSRDFLAAKVIFN